MATAGKARWKVKPKGVETVKQGGWYVKKPAAGGGTTTPRTGTPAGGTPLDQKRSQLPPAEWVGSPGLIGSWKAPPRLDPTRFETMLNPQNQRYFARPRTELTGLSPQTVADVRGFDTQTAQQGDRIRQAYEQLGQQAEANQAAGSATLAGLAGLVGAGQSSTDPTAAALAASSRAGTAASVAPIISDLARQPTVARSSGISNLEAFMAQRLGQRSETIAGYRQSAADAAQAQQELAATLRGQDLTQLGKIAAGKTQVQTAQIRADTATQDRLAKIKTEEARLTTQLQIAQGNNQTSRANNIRNNLVKLQAEKTKLAGKKATPETIRAWAKRAREMWDGIPRRITDDQGNTTTQYLTYSYQEIIHELVAMGAPRARARAIASGITGQGPGMTNEQARLLPPSYGVPGAPAGY